MIPDLPSRDYHNEIKSERDALRAEIEQLRDSRIRHLETETKLVAEVERLTRERDEAREAVQSQNEIIISGTNKVIAAGLRADAAERDAESLRAIVDDNLRKILHLENRIEEEHAEVERLSAEAEQLKSLYEHAVATRVYHTEERNKALARAEAAERKLATAVKALNEIGKEQAARTSTDAADRFQSITRAALAELEKDNG